MYALSILNTAERYIIILERIPFEFTTLFFKLIMTLSYRRRFVFDFQLLPHT